MSNKLMDVLNRINHFVSSILTRGLLIDTCACLSRRLNVFPTLRRSSVAEHPRVDSSFCFFLLALVVYDACPEFELKAISPRAAPDPRCEKRVFVTFGAVLPDRPPSLALGLLLALKELNVPKSASGPLHRGGARAVPARRVKPSPGKI